MTPRIESAEIVSFRLQLPTADLRLVPELLSDVLSLALDEAEGEHLLSVLDSDDSLAAKAATSHLRFKPFGDDSVLTDIALTQDSQGLFFERVLVALMVRYQGDLHARVLWSTPERNTEGDFAEVHLVNGRVSENEASSTLNVHSSLDVEVQGALARARVHWAEYQRLKSKRSL